MKATCLIVDKMHPSICQMLEQIGVAPSYQPNCTRQEIISQISNFDGLLIRSKTFVDKTLLKNATHLKFVARAGSGIDNLDENYLKSKNIVIFNAPEGNRDAVGEHTIGLMLSLLHNLHQGHQQVLQNIWDREGNRGAELGEKTVGIIGYGNMGTAVAKRLTAFGCRVLAYDKYHPKFNTNYATSVPLATIKEETDILSLHVPLAPDTRGMTGGTFFNEFKKSIIFINTSRGEIAPIKAIVNGIASGKIIKAGLDVLENEKLNKFTTREKSNFNSLKNSGKVLFTPHVAGWTTESYIKLNKVLVEKISAFFDGNLF